MLVRSISGAVIVVVMMALIWAGGIVTTIGLAVISCIAYTELLAACGVREAGAKKPCVFDVTGILVILGYYALIYLLKTQQRFISMWQSRSEFLMLVVVLYLALLMSIFVFTFPKYKAKQVICSFFSFVYGPVMISFALQTRLLLGKGDIEIGCFGWNFGFYNLGFFAVWMIFIAAWGSDTCAYFVGVLFGKHRVTPRLSPKKSLEGYIGGVAGAGLLGLLYGAILKWTGHVSADMLWCFAVLGVCGSFFGLVGDLAASAVKRDFNIKDYGNCIPGHGGIMDRFDSVIFTAPMIYLLSTTLLYAKFY
ncbi:MAG: phosphatidate cytidylyltransferase [Lachnospiraceae bacterium]|nr:phosphatidate cytidylyltransferase [Lachnospiraceae bacterium]MBR6849850.1 phosphatidate cytidylyltransferase [Lachnospiraceae bacterium]